MCIFCKIAAGDIPAKKLYEDEDVLAFRDINPAAEVHFLIIPKKHIASMAELTSEDTGVMGKIMVLAQRLAIEAGTPNGFRTIVNTGPIGRQEVPHLHVHILGGSKPLPAMLVKQ